MAVALTGCMEKTSSPELSNNPSLPSKDPRAQWKEESRAMEKSSNIPNEDGNNGAEISNDGSGPSPEEVHRYKRTVSTPAEREVNATSPDANKVDYAK